MKNTMHKILLLTILSAAFSLALANNITVTNGSLTGRDDVNHFVLVKFTVGWENSWRASTPPNNIDAAWIFVKYKINGNYVSAAGATSSSTTIMVTSTASLRVGMPVAVTAGSGAFAAGTVVTAITNGTTFTVSAVPSTGLSGGASVVTGYAIWQHATINTIGYTAPSGSIITPASDGTGACIYRSTYGNSTFTAADAQLRWNYGANGLSDIAMVDIKVFAIEMVYVSTGSFTVGTGGTEIGSFSKGTWSSGAPIPFSIASENALTVEYMTGDLWYISSDYSGDHAGPIPAAFPKGYSAFYCMKYEISQQQYVDFLNTLTYTQQTTRTVNAPSSVAGTAAMFNVNAYDYSYRNGIDIMTPGVSSSTPAVYGCNLDGNVTAGETADGQNIACNHVCWADVAAYLDWSGLRPMTELEYEKACRGTMAAVPNEYAWGTTGIASLEYTLSNSGAANEVILTNYNINVGNADYGATTQNGTVIDGPVRAGIFAGTSGNSGRVTAGATYYGIMEMSGNLLELTVTVGHSAGRAFTGTHGNGALDAATGNADVSNWPGTNAAGSGFRGGSWYFDAPYLQVSDRKTAAMAEPSRDREIGGRGVRLAP